MTGAGMSSAQVTRFIRLNSLIPALQEAVDEGRLAFNPAVEVSYLDEADQEIVQEIMDRDQISPSLSQAQKLHRLSQIDKIDDSAIEAVMTVEKPMYETITFRRNTVEKYFPAGTTGKEIERTIIRLLARRGNASETGGADICRALGDELHVRAVFRADHAVRNNGGKK